MGLLAYDAEACSTALNVFVGEVFQYLRHKAKQELGLARVELAHLGSVTAFQGAGGAAKRHPHLHTLPLDDQNPCARRRVCARRRIASSTLAALT